MSQQNALLIFQKNLVYGKVKTRLAATVGNDKAFAVYKDLIHHTQVITQSVHCDVIIYYSNFIDEIDNWNSLFKKALQTGNDLGSRMQNAFTDVLQNKYEKAVIIGTDCPTIKSNHIEEAFRLLDDHDVVIGPSADGGYYLLGMKELYTPLFKNIAWSTPSVFQATMDKCNTMDVSVTLLPVLHDVDTEQDLIHLSSF